MARVTVPYKNGSDHHPPYAQMIFTAITAMNEKNGSSRTAIAKFIDRAFANLPKTHASLLTTHLRRLKQNGHLTMVKHSYKLPKLPEHPYLAVAPHRGRGRPRKTTAVITGSHGLVLPRRGRGRPPNPKLKPVLPKRPRGRPRKDVAVGSPSRPRGRPPKIDGSVSRPRGRPRKIAVGSSTRPPKKQRVVADADTSPRRPRGRPPKTARVIAAVE